MLLNGFLVQPFTDSACERRPDAALNRLFSCGHSQLVRMPRPRAVSSPPNRCSLVRPFTVDHFADQEAGQCSLSQQVFSCSRSQPRRASSTASIATLSRLFLVQPFTGVVQNIAPPCVSSISQQAFLVQPFTGAARVVRPFTGRTLTAIRQTHAFSQQVFSRAALHRRSCPRSAPPQQVRNRSFLVRPFTGAL